MPMPPPTISGRSTSRSKPLPSGPRTWIASPGRAAARARVPGPIGSIEERELARRREAEAHRSRQQPARRLEHEELAGSAGIDVTALEPEQRVRPDRLDADHTKPLAGHDALPTSAWRSWRLRATSDRAYAIA